MPLTSPPDRAALFDWLRRSDDGAPGDEYDLALAAAVAGQAARCQVDPYTESLHLGVLRRAAKILASKGMSLGVFDSGDFGQNYLPRWDEGVETAELPYRHGGFA